MASSGTIYYRETSTAIIPFQLFADNTPIDLTDVTKVEIVLVNANGKGTATKFNTADDASTLAIYDATTGRVNFTPDGVDDLTYALGPYKCYFNVYTSVSSKYAVPDKDELTIVTTEGF